MIFFPNFFLNSCSTDRICLSVRFPAFTISITSSSENWAFGLVDDGCLPCIVFTWCERELFWVKDEWRVNTQTSQNRYCVFPFGELSGFFYLCIPYSTHYIQNAWLNESFYVSTSRNGWMFCHKPHKGNSRPEHLCFLSVFWKIPKCFPICTFSLCFNFTWELNDLFAE